MKYPLVAGAIAAAITLVTLPAQALFVTFGGQNTNVTGGDYSGLTSNHVPVSNMISPTSGYFIETFDQATYTPIPVSASFAAANPDFVGMQANAVTPGGTVQYSGTTAASPIEGPGYADAIILQGQGCSFNAWGGPVVTVEGGGFAVQKGNTGRGANPAGDSTCYGFGPQPDAPTNTIDADHPAKVKIDYSPILASGVKINYLGIYYGSVSAD